jgi:hypothetical protein
MCSFKNTPSSKQYFFAFYKAPEGLADGDQLTHQPVDEDDHKTWQPEQLRFLMSLKDSGLLRQATAERSVCTSAGLIDQVRERSEFSYEVEEGKKGRAQSM